MRFNKKKMLSGMLAVGISLSCLTAPVSALNIQDQVEQIQQQENAMTDFTDMTGHWAYDYVARMVQDGLFAGTSDTTFSPNDNMSEVQFLTVVLRKAFPTELEQYNAQYTSTWYDGAYRLGLAKGIINSSVYGSGADMNRDITRERMTDMAIKGLKAMGENTQSNIAGVTNSVNDLNKCGDTFKMSMIEAYTMGIIAGKDTDKATGKMNVDPKGTATRAEGATVLYRFAYPDARTAPDFSEPVTPPSEDINGPITIYEGQTRTGRPAKAGDTFVKADGTKVTITLNKDGVIDPALGIAPDLGLTYTENGVTRTVKDQERVTWVESWGQCLSGADYRGQMYQVNPLTGAGMFEYEWAVYENNNWPNYKGTTQYEVSADKCFMWVSGDWYSIVNTPELAQLVK